MKIHKNSLTKTSIILMLGMFIVVAINNSAFARQTKGEDLPKTECTRVNKDGTETKGSCKDVCWGKTVYRAIINGKYVYHCASAKISWSSPLINTTPSDTLSRPVYKPTPKPSKHFYNNYKRNWTFTR